MPFDLLLLPLLGGYVLISRSNTFAFKVAKQSGERLLFASAFAAVWLLVAARILVLALAHYCPGLAEIWHVFAPWDFSATAATAFVLGVIAPYGFNAWKPIGEASRESIQNHGDGLDRLFYEATEAESQVVLTLSGGKVYAGWLDWMPLNPGADDAFIRILPTISGQREVDGRIRWTTFYQKVYLQLPDNATEAQIEAFTKVVPISEIVTAGLFDPDMYYQFNPDAADGVVETPPDLS